MVAGMTFNKNKGFSLIEVLISILVISIAFVSIVRLQSYVALRSEQIELQYQAVRVAEAQVMLWQNVGATVDCDGTAKLLTLDNLQSCQINFSPFKGDVEVIGNPKVDLSGNILLKELMVSVTWTDRSGERGTITLVSAHTPYSPLLRS